jgi:hypothetical protein
VTRSDFITLLSVRWRAGACCAANAASDRRRNAHRRGPPLLGLDAGELDDVGELFDAI